MECRGRRQAGHRYRIYRRDSSGLVEAIGSSPVAGYADVLLDVDESYAYRITSMSKRLIESEPREWIGLPKDRILPLVFADGFESSN